MSDWIPAFAGMTFMDVVWADTVVTDGALVACMRDLRKTLQ
jgi:DNA-binding winged helix-turn-helix (wHTH) protein